MTINPTICTAIEQGIECRYTAVMAEPVPLCQEHLIRIALLAIPEIVAQAMRDNQSGGPFQNVPPEEARALTVGAVPVSTEAHLGGVHLPVVYFIEHGSRVKIGTSTNLRRRVQGLSVSLSSVILTLQGGPTLERALHRRFEPHRVEQTEWFDFAEPIAAYVAAKQEQLRSVEKAEAEAAQLEQLLAEEAKRQAVSILALQVARAAAVRVLDLREALTLEEVPPLEAGGEVELPDSSRYPNGTQFEGPAWESVWGLLECQPGGFTYREVAALLPSVKLFGGRGTTQKYLDSWRGRGLIVGIGERRNRSGPPVTVFQRIDRLSGPIGGA